MKHTTTFQLSLRANPVIGP